MTIAFDQHAINHMITAVKREMTPQAIERTGASNTIFMGGLRLNEEQQTELASFGLRKNYNIVFLSVDPTCAEAGPIEMQAVATDGLTVGVTLTNGRLWKRDRRSAAILIFPDTETTVRLSTKGCMIMRQAIGPFHDHGYDLALEAIRARAAGKPGVTPIVSTLGSMLTVFDVRTMVDAFANAE